MDLDLGIITEAEKRQKKKLLLDYLYANLKNHNFWAYRYFFCEFLALLNVLGEYYIFSLLYLLGLDRHMAWRSHNSLIADDDDDDEVVVYPPFFVFASFYLLFLSVFFFHIFFLS